MDRAKSFSLVPLCTAAALTVGAGGCSSSSKGPAAASTPDTGGGPSLSMALDVPAGTEEFMCQLVPFPEQLGRSMGDGAFHLGGGDDAPGVDPERECYPTGQGVGAVRTLVPAGQLVTRIVDEAEQVITAMGRLAGD